MWIDSHCHLNHERIEGAGDVAALIKNAKENNVDGMLTVCCNIKDEYEELVKIASNNDDVWCSVGTHPHDSGLPDEVALTANNISEKATADKNIIAIGESGLDYYYNNSEPDAQRASFKKHIKACLETDMPLIVHSRDADEETAQILKEEGKGTLRGVMHCFSSGPDLAKAALDLGFYISFSGIVTFKKATELQEIAKDVPLDRILVETDAPFLAPEPHRGKTNEPALIGHTGAFLADLKGISPEEMAKITTENFFTLFNKA